MKKIFNFIVGTIVAITVLSAISPEFRQVMKKHIPVVGNDVVNMADDLVQAGLNEAKMKPENREIANRSAHDIADLSHAGFEYIATEDEALIGRGTADVKDLFEICTGSLNKMYQAQTGLDNPLQFQ